MTSEDLLFEKLKKSSFEELQKEFIRIKHKYTMTSDYHKWSLEREQVAKLHGWTVPEWQRENYHRYMRNFNDRE